MKKVTIALVCGMFVFTAAALFANAKLQTAHKGYKGFKAITKCADCHNDTTKLEKKKGADYKALLKTPSCAGQGCHK
ncbi:MAG TPA: hypothetical protein P5346_15790 [Spirochaetota bacterium]|nr:hypothetical protein [Spirochaetota bacterium]HSA16202.1 hypothetical protein [Spirochaetota bacterium]